MLSRNYKCIAMALSTLLNTTNGHICNPVEPYRWPYKGPGAKFRSGSELGQGDPRHSFDGNTECRTNVRMLCPAAPGVGPNAPKRNMERWRNGVPPA